MLLPCVASLHGLPVSDSASMDLGTSLFSISSTAVLTHPPECGSAATIKKEAQEG